MPAALTLSGRCVDCPPITLRPRICLPYCTGIFLTESVMKTVPITATTMSATSTTSDRIPNSGLVTKLFRTVVTPPGKPAIIPTVMINEMPCPMPRSVICSPNHITNDVPAVSVKTTRKCHHKLGSLTISPACPVMFSGFRKTILIVIPWMILSITVPYRVYCVIFFLPSGSLESFSKEGTMTPRSCIMMEALIYGCIPSAKIVI